MDDARFAIQMLLMQPHATRVLAGHRWAHEGQRWQEFAHCLLEATLPLSSVKVRELTARLAFLGLLAPHAWKKDEREATEARLRAALESHGVSERKAAKAVAALGEAADILNKKFDGKVQKVLRAVGDDAMALLTHRFALKSLSDEEQRLAFTIWLQSVCNLPISGQESAIAEFCRAHKVTRDALADAADAMDLNLAALDDLIHAWAAGERRKS
jgi:hypothetical protein